MSPTPVFSPLVDLKNRFDFYLRNLIQWQKSGFIEPVDQEIEKTFPTSELTDLAQRLEKDYGLAAYREKSLFSRYQEILTRLLELETCLPEIITIKDNDRQENRIQNRQESIVHVLDIGARNWSYVPALWKFIEKRAFSINPLAGIVLEGIELDAYRIYTDGYSRLDYATFFCQQLIELETIQQPNRLCFVPGDVMKDCPKAHYDLVFCFLPFVFEEPLLDWGLPKHYFQPKAFLGRLLSLLNDTGTLILVNQGQEEFEEQRRLLHQVEQLVTDRYFSIDPIGRLPNPFNTFKIDHWGWRISIKPCLETNCNSTESP